MTIDEEKRSEYLERIVADCQNRDYTRVGILVQTYNMDETLYAIKKQVTNGRHEEAVMLLQEWKKSAISSDISPQDRKKVTRGYLTDDVKD